MSALGGEITLCFTVNRGIETSAYIRIIGDASDYSSMYNETV